MASRASDACAAGSAATANANAAASIPFGPPVLVTAGRGKPPLPTFGTLHDADYQLASETVYGNVPADESPELLQSQLKAVLHVRCNHFDELYGGGNAVAGSAGNLCGTFVAREISLLDVSPLGQATMDCPNTMYSVSDTTFTVIDLRPYDELGDPAGVEGSYTIVDRFVQVGAMIADAGAEPVPDVSLPISLARDPRCPSEPPQVGDACLPDPAPLHCEYGGDATRRCTTIARCGLQADGSFSFQLETDTRCVPNAADCLARFDSDAASSIDAADGGDSDPCGDHYLSCDYPEGACACLPQSFSLFTWTCRSRGDVTPTPATALACPKVRPLAGDSCANEGETCDYDGTCESRPSLGPTMFCQSGYWKRLDAIYECPALPP